jgi:hypothetical protein
MTNNVSVEPPKPPSWWEQGAIQRAIDVASGRVPTAVQTPQAPQYGVNYVGSQLKALEEGALRGIFNSADRWARTFSGRPVAPAGSGFGDLMYDPIAAQSRLGGITPGFVPGQSPDRGTWTGQKDYPQPGSTFYREGAEQEDRARTQALVNQKRAEEEAANQPAPTDYLAEAMAMLGGGPDYGAYRASLEDMVLNPETGLSPRIQAMYNQLAERAGENQQRVADIYGGASAGLGSVYDSAAANTEQAFSSAQQQAADQMARLGIEEAAGQVIPQAAGQQASALAALEQGRAGGLSALGRYGASSGDFSSQMGQVAQQRGLEQNQALLGALQRQLAESQLMEAQGAYDARLRAPGLARDLFEASQLGQPQGLTFEQQMAQDAESFRRAQAAADIEMQYGQRAGELYDVLVNEQGMTREEAQAEIEWRRQSGLL